MRISSISNNKDMGLPCGQVKGILVSSKSEISLRICSRFKGWFTLIALRQDIIIRTSSYLSCRMPSFPTFLALVSSNLILLCTISFCKFPEDLQRLTDDFAPFFSLLHDFVCLRGLSNFGGLQNAFLDPLCLDLLI